MNYNFKLVRKEDFTPTYWAGGMASQLTTFPENSSFAKRDFLWRLGFANIDISESTFSSLPNISRTLMVTNGKLILDHEEHHSACLGPFEQDSFNGAWKTTTKGKASVFNLMTQNNYSGELIHTNLNPSCNKNFNYTASYEKEITGICIYPLSGTLKTKINNSDIMLKSGDLLVLSPISSSNSYDFSFYNSSKEVLHMIISVIYRR